MKSILVPVENHNTIAAVLATAALFRKHLGGRLDGIALHKMQIQVAGVDPVVAVSLPQTNQNEKETIAKAGALFQKHLTAKFKDTDQTFWNGEAALDDISLSHAARIYDLTVLGCPSVDGGARMTTLEALLFDSGRPILIAPAQVPKLLGTHVVVSWNCSTQAARTLAFTMPILHKAKKVSILTIEEAVVTGPSGEKVCANLSANGIEASNYVISAKGRKSGAAILAEATALGCDLLIKSAYTQNRLHQMIFGGATSYILANTNIPVLMAN